MEENKNLQPDPQISPLEQLDLLLAQFLDEPDEEAPAAPQEAPADEEAPSIPEEAPIAIAEDLHPEELAEAPAEDLPAEEPNTILALDLPAADADAPVPVEDASLIPSEDPIPAAEDHDIVAEEAAPAEESSTSEEEIAPLSDTWIGEILETPMVTEEIGADESAATAAGLIHPEEQACSDTEEAAHPEPDVPSSADPAVTDIKEPENMAKTAPAPELTQPLPEEAPRRPIRKTRPRNKTAYGFFSLPHLAATVIWLAIIVFVGVGLGNILWAYTADMLAFGREDRLVEVTIDENDDLDSIAQKLQISGLIKYPSLFKLYAGLSDAMEDINPGTYNLNTLYDYNALVDSMSGYASRATVKVVVPEGYNCAQIFQLLENKGVSTVEKLTEAAANISTEDYWFLNGLDSTATYWLEGYLFPDTYTFYLNHDADSVLEKFLSNFNKRFTDQMREKLITLNERLSDMMRANGLSEEYIAQHQMTLKDVVIVASMIEKEAANTTEGYTVSSVIYNRLTNPNAYPYLQIDATLVYITGHSELTMEDLNLDSPYNTYKYAGLIPGPITNPSQASLAAALDPDDTDYYYYALNPATGTHKFSRTLQEHEDFLESLRNNSEE